MTLAERKIIWNKRKIEKRRKALKKLSFIAIMSIVTVLMIIILSSVFSKTAQAKEEKIYYKYYTVYEVKPGDTLYKIASEFSEGFDNVEEFIDEVKFMNWIHNGDKIKAGQKIHVPYYSEEIK